MTKAVSLIILLCLHLDNIQYSLLFGLLIIPYILYLYKDLSRCQNSGYFLFFLKNIKLYHNVNNYQYPYMDESLIKTLNYNIYLLNCGNRMSVWICNCTCVHHLCTYMHAHVTQAGMHACL